MGDVCSQCGEPGAAWSESAHRALCERCYGRLPSARYQRPSPGGRVRLAAPRPPQPDEFQELVESVWARMLRDGYCQSMGTRAPVVLVGWCPSCFGCLSVRLRRHPSPDVRFVCESACGQEAIVAALGRAYG